jgi:biopolymer transport protein ExbD
MRKKNSSEGQPEVVLQVTPMLDMTFQLMFFFLTSFNPSESVKEGELDLSLPAKSDTAASNPSDVKPLAEAHKEDIDDKAVVTISLRGQKDPANRGLISYLTINTDNTSDEEIKGTVQEREAILKEKLEKVKPAEREGKDGKKKVPTVRMAAESDVRWSQVMKMMDVCYSAGYQVSFVKPPDLAGNQ